MAAAKEEATAARAKAAAADEKFVAARATARAARVREEVACTMKAAAEEMSACVWALAGAARAMEAFEWAREAAAKEKAKAMRLKQILMKIKKDEEQSLHEERRGTNIPMMSRQNILLKTSMTRIGANEEK